MSTNVHFTFLDYFFFSIVFIVSIGIGLYFAFKLKMRQSVNEYFLGGKKLGVLPVSLSLLASTLTGSTTMGQAMETYAYGLHNVSGLVAFVIAGIMVDFIFLPVFYDLQLMSSFSYLEMRFDKSVKVIASSIYVITGLFIIPLTLYVPALAFQEVTGLDLHVVAVICGLICICYTSIGGFRAVVWTDVFQSILIFLSVLIIFAVGLINVGGLENVWKAMERGGRTQMFKTELTLETRGSLWTYLFSVTFILIYICNLTQSGIQRYLALPTYEKARQACWIQVIFFTIMQIIIFIIGGIIYTTYEGCDLVKLGKVTKVDQIFPLFIQEKAFLFPGSNGIFIAGLFSVSLSTTSTYLNTLGGTIYMDFLSTMLSQSPGRSTNWILNLIVAAVGAIGIGMIFVIEQMGSIFAITAICFTIPTVGIFGLFFSGMIFKQINSKGAKCGVIVSMIFIAILIVGSLSKKPDPILPVGTGGCILMNTTNSWDNLYKQPEIEISHNEALPWLFRMNFHFHCIFGLFLNILVGLIVSFLSGGNTVEDQRLLVKFLRYNIPRENLLPQAVN